MMTTNVLNNGATKCMQHFETYKSRCNTVCNLITKLINQHVEMCEHMSRTNLFTSNLPCVMFDGVGAEVDNIIRA